MHMTVVNIAGNTDLHRTRAQPLSPKVGLFVSEIATDMEGVQNINVVGKGNNMFNFALR